MKMAICAHPCCYKVLGVEVGVEKSGGSAVRQRLIMFIEDRCRSMSDSIKRGFGSTFGSCQAEGSVLGPCGVLYRIWQSSGRWGQAGKQQ